MRTFQCGRYRLPLGERAYVMGILNITPDSFSDGGSYFSLEEAVRHAREMVEAGADILDLGGQSTRPGFQRISPEEELSRVLPVLTVLRGEMNLPLSIDTFYPEVARECLRHGADLLNDVTGFDDPQMVKTAAEDGKCGCILMHHTEESEDILEAIPRFFERQKKTLMEAGVALERICLDTGVGFGKTYEQNLEILANADRLRDNTCCNLMAASRKRVVGMSCGNPPPDQRMAGTVAAHSISIFCGVDIIRAHDVPEAVQAARMAMAVRGARRT